MMMDSHAAQTASDLVKDGSEATFMTDVIDASMDVPVLVDFWGPGCQPCATLKPILEKIVLSMGGAIKLVKLNAQECQNISMQMRIQSVPTVYCFRNGQPVDGFQGAIPESELRKFIEKQIGENGSPIMQALQQAKELFEEKNFENAQEIYMQILQHDNTNPEAIAGVIRTHIGLGNKESAQEIADQLPDEYRKNEHIASAIAAISLSGGSLVDTSELERLLEADPNNHQARFDLAMALYGAARIEEALQNLLTIVRADRSWNEDGARQQMLKIFEAVGLTHPVVIKMRKKLTTVLF